jgi:hypothetical protein
MTVVINGSTGITFPDSTDQGTGYANGIGFRNRIINGDMRIDQRNNGAAVAGISSGTNYIVDRWSLVELTDAVFTAGQDTSVPTGEGFVNSFKITTTTADASIGAAQYAFVAQRIEGTNVADLMFGSASAKTITVSFWIRSSLTGTFSGALSNSTFNYSYAFEYSISAADTWEKKTITVSGATAGTWLTTNGIGLQVIFSMGHGSNFDGTVNTWEPAGDIGISGSVAVAGTLNATWFVTGVQLEVGSVATPFERRPYGTELALCQRYYYKISPAASPSTLTGAGVCASTTNGNNMVGMFPVTMRIAPTALEQSGTASHYRLQIAGVVNLTLTSVPTFTSGTNENIYTVNGVVASGLTLGYPVAMQSNNVAGYLAWSAEL